VKLVFVNPLSEVVEKLQRADEQKEFMRPEFLFLTVAEAVASLSLKGPSLSNV
jgi:sulfate transporter 3